MRIAAATSIVRVTCGAAAAPRAVGPSGVVARELPGDAPAARSAPERPLQRLGARRLDVRGRAAHLGQPVRDDVEIPVLVELVERDPQPEPLRQRDLLLGGLARMDLLADAVVLEVLLHELRHQVAAVRRRVDEHVVGGGRDRAVERDLERLVARLRRLEREVVAEHDEPLRPPGDEIDDVREIDEVLLVDLDQAQALAVEAVEERLDERALAGAARAGEQHVVGRPAGDELAGVALDQRLLPVDALQVGEPDLVRVRDRREPPAAVALAPAERDRRVPVRRRRGRRNELLDPVDQPVQPVDQPVETAGLVRSGIPR